MPRLEAIPTNRSRELGGRHPRDHCKEPAPGAVSLPAGRAHLREAEVLNGDRPGASRLGQVRKGGDRLAQVPVCEPCQLVLEIRPLVVQRDSRMQAQAACRECAGRADVHQDGARPHPLRRLRQAAALKPAVRGVGVDPLAAGLLSQVHKCRRTHTYGLSRDAIGDQFPTPPATGLTRSGTTPPRRPQWGRRAASRAGPSPPAPRLARAAAPDPGTPSMRHGTAGRATRSRSPAVGPLRWVVGAFALSDEPARAAAPAGT
jgi:hypothetical protein